MRLYTGFIAIFLLSPLSRAAPTDPFFPYDLNYSYTQVDLDTNQIVLQFDWQHAKIPVGFYFNDSAPESLTFFTSIQNPEPDFFNNATCTTSGSLKQLIGDCQYGFLNPASFTFYGTKTQQSGTTPEIVTALFNLSSVYQNGTYATQSFYFDYAGVPSYHELGILTIDTHLPEPGSAYFLMAGGALLAGYVLWDKHRGLVF